MSSVESVPPTEHGPNPFELMLRRWKLSLALIVAGLVVGLLAALVQSEEYTAEARVAVGYGNLSAGAIAGFPEAAGDLASNYARYVNDQGLSGKTTSGEPLEGVELTGSPIPESNVIRIEAVSTDEDAAVEAARRTADGLMETVNNPEGIFSDEDILENFNDVTRELAAARNTEAAARARLTALRNASGSPQTALDTQRERVADAVSTRSVLELLQSSAQTRYINATTDSDTADLVLVNDAEVVQSSLSGALQRYGLLGLIVGGVGALIVTTVLDRRSRTGPRRLRGDTAT